MSEVIQVSEVPKTFEERRLNAIYMKFIKSDRYIPEVVVRDFLADQNKIRKENPIYNEKLN